MDHKLFDAERRFLNIIWEAEPVNSTELSRLTLSALGWKKSTTYNMIRRLAERGFVINENATVRSCVTREEVARQEGEELIEKSYSGSIPAFLAAYLKDRRLTAEEALELKHMIEEAER